jgi:hypothetical protein
MPFDTTSIDQGLTTIAADYGYASLHSAYSATGANELTGGSPAYARELITWAAAAGEAVSSSSIAAAFNVPASSTVAWVGIWSAATGGVFGGMGPNGATTSNSYLFACPTASPGVFTAPGTAYANGQTVVLFPGVGSGIPAGFTAGTIYYVVSVSGITFQLAATSGGSGINATAAGSGIVQAINVESFVAQGTATLSTETLSIV